ncbi:glycoside hydrolase family 88/105 protein [Vallitalea okinawensis]|uniref:glycoside hydrolase family 88/105 protein n=1 Tax=Vallitalea okinawensis TaxID=2078660 RepID=UPI001300626E|nr:glycoside hydrolase family 88 protein [Vallitalea okinawensis]
MLTREEILLKCYKLYEALKESERKILAGEEHWKADLQFSVWNWRQGVGLYGIFKLYEVTMDEEILNFMEGWIQRRLEEGQPDMRHINTVCPMLTVTSIYEINKKAEYLSLIEDWAHWVMEELTRTKEAGFQHVCGKEGTPSFNDQQLWDDTLFMTVLFLAKAGVLLNREDYVQEAARQFLIHTKYLADRKTGLWYHVWTFNGHHAYTEALWARGNAWITSGIPEFLKITQINGAVRLFLQETLNAQTKTLEQLQDKETGLWHTLLDHEDSYLETTGTAGITYGTLMAMRLNLLDDSYREMAIAGLQGIYDNINMETGKLELASDGTALGAVSLNFYKDKELHTRAYAQGLGMMVLTEALNHR